ncbi:MAG: caspase family protein [Thermodesulfobacteriota bacterium]
MAKASHVQTYAVNPFAIYSNLRVPHQAEDRPGHKKKPLCSLASKPGSAWNHNTALAVAVTLVLVTWIVHLSPSVSVAADPDRATAVSRQTAQSALSGVSSLPSGDLYAVIVGASKYKNSTIPSLKLAAKDATDFAKFIDTQKDLFRKTRVLLLTNESASKAGLEKYLFYELRQAGKDDTIVLFFSGHGAVDPKRPGEFFFLTHDADPEFLEVTALNMTGLRFLRNLDCPRVVMIADACHSGGFTDWHTRSAVIPLRLFLRDFSSSTGRVIITSSRPDEYSLEGNRMDNGVFTHFLIEGLKGAADKDGDGVVNVKEAYDFVYDQTRAATGGAQHPQFHGTVEGVFPLSVSASFAARPPTVLEVFTDPPGAEVYVSGKLAGQTEADGSLVVKHLPLGRPLPVTVKKMGWKEASIGPITFSREALHITGQFVKLQPAGGILELVTDPPRAEVYVGDRLAGISDETGSIRLENLPLGQPLLVMVKKSGWREASVGQIMIPQDKILVSGKRVKLERALGAVLLVTDPAGASVFVDGKEAGRTDQHGSLVLDQLPLGKRLSIKVRKEGWQEASLEPITISPEQLIVPTRQVKLSPAFGTLELITDPPDAEVYVHDRLAGRSGRNGSFLLQNLPLGKPISVRVQKRGWLEASLGPITISPERTHVAGRKVELKRATGTLDLSTDPSEAEVYVGDTLAGTSKKDGSLLLANLPLDERLDIRVKKKGWLEASIGPIFFTPDKLKIKPNRVKLIPARGLLELVVEPAPADVYVGERRVGETKKDGTFQLVDLPIEKPIYVKVKKKGWQEASLEAVTFSPETLRANKSVHLQPAVATLQIQTEPGEVTVKLNGQYLGTTGGDGKLAAADIQVMVPHSLEFEKKGYGKEAILVTVPESAQGRTFESKKVRLKAEATAPDAAAARAKQAPRSEQVREQTSSQATKPTTKPGPAEEPTARSESDSEATPPISASDVRPKELDYYERIYSPVGGGIYHHSDPSIYSEISD